MTNYKSKYYSLSVDQLKTKVRLVQEVHHQAVYTEDLPMTISLLEKYLPTIFTNECFNDKHVSFRQEAEKTEVAHLLEHIILENLKLLAVEKYGWADYSGETSWDWLRDKYGTFKISINSKAKDDGLFQQALRRSVMLLDRIYENTLVN